jgi:CheY-like chemotaxis protein
VEDRGRGFDLAELRARQLASEAFGLFSVQERIAYVSGTIAIESTPGAGTRVTLVAPLGGAATAAVDEAPGGAVGETSRPRPACDAGSKVRVLIVDDHEVVREGLGTMLRTERDLEVVGEAATADEAIELARALEPDVVIMDVSLGQSSGIDATAAIRRNQPHINIIALSMHDDAYVINAMREAGAVAYLSKTGAAEELIAAIRTFGRPTT